MKRLQSIYPLILLVTAALCLPAQAGEFPKTWYGQPRPVEHTEIESNSAPPLAVGDWVGPEFDSKEMKGSIVIIDFWATWCQPCIASMPKNTKLAEKYAKEGVKFVGICVSGDPTAMPTIVENNGANYPNAFMKGQQILEDWPVQWYPTYAVLDRKGVVRAFAINPDRVDDVVETLLIEEAKEDGRARMKPTWIEGTDQKRERLKDLEAKADKPPAIKAASWHNSEALDLDKLKGKVVVLDFWGTFSPRCIKSIEYHNELHDKYKEQGLVFIGVCATLKSELLSDVIEQHAPRYPICVDDDNKTTTAYSPDGFPDYYLIDKFGNLRLADCSNASIEEAIVALLTETKPPKKQDGEGEEKPDPEKEGDADEKEVGDV